jgi:CheY-like chemotaxis protein
MMTDEVAVALIVGVPTLVTAIGGLITVMRTGAKTDVILGHVNSEKTAAEGRIATLRVENDLLREMLTDKKATAALLAQAVAQRTRELAPHLPPEPVVVTQHEPVKVEVVNNPLVTSTAVPALPPSRVLIVDDDPATVKLATLLLTQAGVETQATDDETGLVDALSAFHPQLVLMDLTLYADPDAGVRLTRWLSVEHPEILVVLMSATVLSAAAVKATGAIGAIWKPIDPDAFAATVGAYLLAVRKGTP